MAREIPNMWSFLTPCQQVTWHRACAVEFCQHIKDSRSKILSRRRRRWRANSRRFCYLL